MEKKCLIQLATLEEGVAGLLEALLVPLARENGIQLQILENNDFDDFTSLIRDGKVQAAILPQKHAFKFAGQKLLRNLNAYETSFLSGGTPMYTLGENVMGVPMGQLNSIAALNAHVDDEELIEFLLLLLELICRLFCDRQKEVKPIDKNTFEWEINGPDTIAAQQAETCTLQTYQVRFKAENAKLQHIIWNKLPPPGTRSVERTAIDDQGDSPNGKVPSIASLEEQTWQVPFCSPGQFTMKVTVIWKCLIDGQVHTETKEKVITAERPK